MKISQKIIDYAVWYYLKYFPSVSKLRQKLKQKFGENTKRINGLFIDSGSSPEGHSYYGGISDEEIDYIIQEKLKNIIQEDEVIISKIRSFKSRGKSKLYIKQKLYERQEPKELIEKYLQEEFEDGDLENLQKEYEKLKGKYEDKKIIEKLMRKGFRYEDVKKLFY